MADRIFLSHKGANKEIVRLYFRSLKAAGFRPWLDEEELRAGINIDRGIREGFKDARAVVFFITPEFRDQTFLRDEINYAKEEERQKNGAFLIITVILPNEAATAEPQVPDLLRPYLWIKEESQLSTFTRILEALADQTDRTEIGNLEAGVPRELHHVSLAVSNLERSVSFYRDVLGLRLNPNRPKYLFPGAWFALANGQELHLVQNEKGTFRQSTRTRTHLYTDNHLALRVPDIVAFEKRMIEMGYGKKIRKDETLPTRYPQRYFLDPDNHIIEVNADGIAKPGAA